MKSGEDLSGSMKLMRIQYVDKWYRSSKEFSLFPLKCWEREQASLPTSSYSPTRMSHSAKTKTVCKTTTQNRVQFLLASGNTNTVTGNESDEQKGLADCRCPIWLIISTFSKAVHVDFTVTVLSPDLRLFAEAWSKIIVHKDTIPFVYFWPLFSLLLDPQGPSVHQQKIE